MAWKLRSSLIYGDQLWTYKVREKAPELKAPGLFVF
jgi:hypothetical protein